MLEGSGEGIANPERKERGANVEIIIKFMRHGERDKNAVLTNYGREVTKQRAQESGIGTTDFDAVKAIGSNADPSVSGMGRALETADIYAHEIAGDEAFKTRARKILSYESITTPSPYNHRKVYNSHLPENFAELSDEEKVRVSKVAQSATLNHMMSIKTPEADAFRRENAGAFAEVVHHYTLMVRRLHSDSRVLIPAGSHGGNLELLLQQALVHQIDDRERVGFSDLSEIGGDIDPSEAFNVTIKTDEDGELLPLQVTFDNPNRPHGEMHLSPKVLEQVRLFWESLHQGSDEEPEEPAQPES